ncbi:glycoside hydrolase family 25 protein [Streptococcus cuniculipharyngis]|uniref:N-acetylmuramoyl-L-alanine amidase n=1 Tax=Streptococcus cuniculipharyngis TaxID=1562651 RepID=A0A5C5SDJ5_9STRE|nr:glycoside hydrolase family 25 protein [Streptococcus cuniculipharyngis]TWS98250.1 N-acetylmuramoyl-L-alanine amidase [Streptococcus cuniculipharyngis]
MRRRIKPIVVFIFFSLIALIMIIAKVQASWMEREQLKAAQKSIPSASSQTSSEESTTSSEDEKVVLKPIIDVSGWQLPNEINYDVLSRNISGAIVRVFGGSQITKNNNAAYTTGVDKSFKKHITEFQKRGVPVAVYSYALGASIKEMKEEAQIFYKNASPYNPTFYWIDVEEATMSDMNAGVEAFRKELKRLGAKNVGIYIGTYFMEEQEISVDKFDAIWIPTYGSDSGYYEAAPDTTLDYDLHQYTSQGYLNGFANPLDLNQIAVTKNTKSTYEKLFGKIKKKSTTK